MKTLVLFLASAAIAPALYLMSRGARRESWPLITLALGALAIVLAGIHYFTT